MLSPNLPLLPLQPVSSVRFVTRFVEGNFRFWDLKFLIVEFLGEVQFYALDEVEFHDLYTFSFSPDTTASPAPAAPHTTVPDNSPAALTKSADYSGSAARCYSPTLLYSRRFWTTRKFVTSNFSVTYFSSLLLNLQIQSDIPKLKFHSDLSKIDFN